MNNETSKQLHPKVRFPEFRGNWEIISLSKVLIKNSKKNIDNEYSLVQSISNKYGFINQIEYFDNRSISSKNTSNYYVIEKGCFAYNPARINVGSLAYKCDNSISIVSPAYVSFYTKENVCDLFLFYWFSSNEFIIQMKNSLAGSVRKTLNYENLCKIQMNIPSITEQQKIATCLASLDDLIDAESRKLEALKKHKKGLLQRLFPAIDS